MRKTPKAKFLIGMLLLAIGSGCASGRSFDAIVQHAQEKVFPALVFVKPLQQQLGSGERTLSQVYGSGIIISPDGLVVTNSHVAKDSTEIKCVLSSREQVPAHVVGLDIDTDLALLKIDLPNDHEPLPVAEFGDSDRLHDGQFVMALGSPFGFTRSISFGIISSTRRYLDMGTYTLWIQTDAAINPGNSGGPLVNDNGKVIGINTAGIRSGENIGFAIPSNTVKAVVEELQKKGYVERAYIGAQLQPLKDFIHDVLLDQDAGVLVVGVESQSPAATAGLRSGDLLLKCNGREIRGIYIEDLPGIRTMIASLPPEQPADFEILRGQHNIHLTIIPTIKLRIDRKGLDLETWNFSTREIDPFQTASLAYFVSRGVYVFGVKQIGNAAASGLQPGDIILSVETEPVPTLDSLFMIYKRLNQLEIGKRVALFEIMRSGYRMYVVLDFNRSYKPEK